MTYISHDQSESLFRQRNAAVIASSGSQKEPVIIGVPPLLAFIIIC